MPIGDRRHEPPFPAPKHGSRRAWITAAVLPAFIAWPLRAQQDSTATVSDSMEARPTGYPWLPDAVLTPGATLAVTVHDLCTPGYARRVRYVPIAVKRSVYVAYGVPHPGKGDYEMDHLISLELGGSNAVRNLWPQSYRTTPWNARVKDALENELHRRVCSGRMDLATAQHDIAADWIASYQRTFRRAQPVAHRPRPRRQPTRVH